jgi:uncharacterized OsmC-like protein
MKSTISLLADPKSYVNQITTGNHTFIADEPESAGGTDKGPDPITLAMGALGACTTMTIKIYLDHKGWAFERIATEVETSVERIENAALLNDEERAVLDSGRLRRIQKIIRIDGVFNENQLDRIRTIASKCPVNKMLKNSCYITDEIIGSPSGV